VLEGDKFEYGLHPYPQYLSCVADFLISRELITVNDSAEIIRDPKAM
jgi:hypothetical protein